MPYDKRLYGPGTAYKRRAKAVRQRAQNDPNVRCWRCGGRPADGQWNAGHVIEGDPSSPLEPECRTCNVRAAVRTRTRGREPSSFDW